VAALPSCFNCSVAGNKQGKERNEATVDDWTREERRRRRAGEARMGCRQASPLRGAAPSPVEEQRRTNSKGILHLPLPLAVGEREKWIAGGLL
jgi:hypothetical protein